MDRRRRRTRAVAALAATGALAAAAALAAEALPALKAMLWASPEADPVRVFATQPSECLAVPADPARARSVEIGRAAFRTPLLFGGQAARAGLSCESCHRQGRDNPDFQFPGASGAPGTADVTLSLFSSHRGNGVHDPKLIPDLSGPRVALKVANADLPRFIRGLIVEEFDGREPPPAVLTGLVDYVSALTPGNCPDAPRQTVTAAGFLDDTDRAVAAAQAALADADDPTARLMLAAARARLGLIDERYAGLPREQRRLRTADAALAQIQDLIRSGRVRQAADKLARWRTAAPELNAALTRREAASRFNPHRLNNAASQRLPPRPS